MPQPIIVTCALLVLGLAPRVSGMAMSMDELAELRVTPAIQNTTECYDSRFFQQLCFGDTTIEITDAVYGVSPCNSDGNIRHCCQEPGDCTIPVEKKDPSDHPDYYNEILVKCNNRQTCADLQAQWIDHISQWCSGASGQTDYVTLHYMCLTEADRPTTTATSTYVKESSTTTSKPSPEYPVSTATATVVSTMTNVTDEDDNGDEYNSTQTTLIIAVIVAMVVAVVVAVTVWMVCRKRKANSRSDENKTVNDVDPYYTARPGDGPRDPGPPPAQGLNDVIKPATNPYDTGQPIAKAMVSKKPEPNPRAVDKPNIGADLYTEVVKVRPRKNVVLDKSPGEEDVKANNNGSDMTEAGDRASYDLVMQENHGYGTRQGVDGEGDGEGHVVHAEGFPHEGRHVGDQDGQANPDYDLVMTENNAYS